jgi:hypothetical protein
MSWEYLKKLLAAINRKLINLKIPFAIPSGNRIDRKKIFVAICILIIITLSVVMKDFGSIKSVVYADAVKGIGVGIYWDEACTNRTLSLNWGVIDANSDNSLRVYVRNEYNVAVSLRLSASNWIPLAASSYMSINWNYTGQVLSTDEVIPLQLKLTVYPTIIDITNFNFETTITMVGE